MDSVLYIRFEQKRKEDSDLLFDSDSPTPVVAFLSVTSKVAALAFFIEFSIFLFFSHQSNRKVAILSILTYMLLDISMNRITFACIVLFGLRTGTDNIRDYAGLYTKDPFLALSLAPCLLSRWGLPPLAGEFSIKVCVIASYIPGISMNPISARPGGLSGEDPTTHFLPPAPLRKQGLALHLNRVLNCLT